jgi:hypothetical protein
MKERIFDIETDGLDATLIHCLTVGSRSTTDYDNMRKFFTNPDNILIGHNIIRYDIPTVERLLDIEVKAKVVDTLVLSWTLFPRMVRHGLEAWGEHYGVEKPEIKNWTDLTTKEYIHRCEEDVKINTLLWEDIKSLLNEMYDSKDKMWEYVEYLTFKMQCAAQQEKDRWKFDLDRASEGLRELVERKQEKFDGLVQSMPKVRQWSIMNPPAKPYKKDGSLSSTGERWYERLKELNLPKHHNEPIRYLNGRVVEPNPNSHPQIKDWLFSLGWKPRNFDYKRNKETGEVKKIPQIKSADEDGQLCDSVLELLVKEPALEHLDGLFVISHRISIVKGMIENCSDDGYVKAEVQGLTNTLRFKHAVCVNLPKVNKPYGELIRGCLIAPDGYEMCGSDMSGLEDRLKQHFLFPYDPDYVKEMMSEDYDPHFSLALLASAVTPEQIDMYNNGNDDGTIKTIRDTYKSGNYACQYGAGVPRLMLTANITRPVAQSVYDSYWKKNWAITRVAEDQTIKTFGGEKWLLNPINGFWYWLKTEKDAFSTLVQGTGSFMFDMWVKLILKRRKQLTGQFHDEFILTLKVGNREKCEKLIRGAMKELNSMFNLNRELDCDVQFGSRYSEIH